jgi:hypothetical protein
MTIKYTLIFILITSALSAQERVEDFVNVKHTLEDFELKGKVKEMTVIHTGFDNRDGKEKQNGFARTKYIFNEIGKLDTLIIFKRDSSIYKALIISYGMQGEIKKVMDAESFTFDLDTRDEINKEMDFKYVVSSDSKMPKKVRSITIDELYSKNKLLYKYDKKGKLVYVKNTLTEKDAKKIESAVEIKAFHKNYAYNKDGSLKKIKSTYNDKVTVTLDNIEYFEYDHNGNLTKTYQKQLETYEWSKPQSKTYNDKGKLTHYYEGDSLVNDEIYTHNIYYYNEDEILIGEYSHIMGDGEFEWFKRYEYSWDEYGNWLERKTLLKELAHHYKVEDENLQFSFSRRDKREILYYE